MTFKSKKWLVVCISMFASACLMSQEAGTATPRKAAIFVENRAGPAFNDKVDVLNDLLTSRIADKGFSVINREDAINALKTYSSVEITAASATAVSAKVQTPAGQGAVSGEVGKASAAEVSATPMTMKADQALSDSSSNGSMRTE